MSFISSSLTTTNWSSLAMDMSTTSLGAVSVSNKCRYRGYWYPMAAYKLITCAHCYLFVYKKLWAFPKDYPYDIITGEDSAYGANHRLSSDASNETSAIRVCGSLQHPHECWTWKSCCKEAELCCTRQLSEGSILFEDYGKTLCPRTWDGYACWSDTPSGHVATLECPAYVPAVFPGNDAHKTCTANGTWLLNNRQEWTDYSQCSEFHQFEKMYTASIACNSITIILVLPACFIFLYFRQLRYQHRIRLHTCLMFSSFLTSISMVAWEIFIATDRMRTANKEESVLHQNSVGCRLLQLVTRYSSMACFMWMFNEGFHLHRLLVHAFTVPKSLLPYYILGFGLPCLPVSVYAAIRATSDTLNNACWAKSADHFEWLLYSPILLSLLVNVFFMIRIVYIMVSQLEPHPNEPSTFRRAVKAVGVLIPLFGIQFLLFVYRPGEPQSSLYVGFEMTAKIVSSLQGAFIAVVFCYLNKEVRGHLKAVFTRLAGRPRLSHHDFATRSLTLTTQYPSEVTRTRSVGDGADSGAQMIPLKPVYADGGIGGVKEGNFRNGNAHYMGGSGEEMDDDHLLDTAVGFT